MIRRALAYIAATVAGPRQAFTLMLFDEAGFAVAVGALLAAALAWVFIFASWAIAGWEPWLTPWLTISAELYYGWEAIFILPVMMAGWMLFSGAVQILSRLLGGNGSFESTARVLALSIAVSNFLLLIPSLGLAVVALFADQGMAWWESLAHHSGGEVVLWILLGAEALWLGFLTAVGVRVSQKLRNPRSFMVSIPAIVVYYGFLLVFFR